jgi:hypothetical protein
MTKKLSILLIALMLLPSFMLAQKHMVIRADGQKSSNGVFIDGTEVQTLHINKKAIRQAFKDNNNLTDLDKVLFYPFPSGGNSNFGFFGQDWFVQWFVAPADMTINRAGFNVNAVDNPGYSVALKLVTVNWTKDQLENLGETLWGYYEADGNGFNDITAFQDNSDITGSYVDVEGSGAGSPFGADLWSDFGFGASSEPVPSGAVNTYQWTDMSLLGSNPQVMRGDIIGVAVQNSQTTLDADRIGMLATTLPGTYGFKFYTNGRLVSGGPGVGDCGWWSRAYTWDFALDVTLTGDIPPDVNSYDHLPTTLSTADRTVNADISDTNPSGGPAGVATVDLVYSIDGGTTWVTEAMTGTEPNYSAVIPGQPAGTEVTYYLDNITDVQGNTADPTAPVTYTIYKPTPGVNTLLVFNGYTAPSGYPQSYYFGYLSNTSFDHDVWSYGALSADLLNYYTNVIEIATTGRNTIDDDVILAWLNADASHNYAAFGDEWIGTETGWVDGTYGAGDFFFDVLGIAADHNDISYNGVDNPPADGSVVYPQAGTMLGGPLLDKYNQVTTDNSWTAPMVYAPAYEVGVSNWLDGVDFAGDVEVDMTADNFDASNTYAILGHRTLTAGNKVVFGCYDPLSLDSDPENGVEYDWYGAEYEAPQVTMLDFFGITTDVKESNDAIPVKFDLSQNYPNPFNPSTVIKFSIPSNELVSLKIYNVLGKEVATLVNKTMSAGNYEVNFDASNLATGMYVYQITAGNFVSAKKMMLLK